MVHSISWTVIIMAILYGKENDIYFMILFQTSLWECGDTFDVGMASPVLILTNAGITGAVLDRFQGLQLRNFQWVSISIICVVLT